LILTKHGTWDRNTASKLSEMFVKILITTQIYVDQ
jgi:hypothetical protein